MTLVRISREQHTSAIVVIRASLSSHKTRKADKGNATTPAPIIHRAIMKLFTSILLLTTLITASTASLRGAAADQERALGEVDEFVPYAISLFVPPGQVKNGSFKCPGSGSTAANTVDFIASQIAVHAVDFLQKHGVNSSAKDWTAGKVVTGFPNDLARERRRLATWKYTYRCLKSICTCRLCNPDSSDGRLAISDAVLQRKLEDYVEENVLADLQATCGKANKFGFRYIEEL